MNLLGAVIGALKCAVEYKFITTKAAAFSPQTLESKTPVAIKLEDLFRTRDLERIAAHPVDHIVPWRHSPKATVGFEGSGGLSGKQIF